MINANDLDHAETLLVAKKTDRLRTLLSHIPASQALTNKQNPASQADSECLWFGRACHALLQKVVLVIVKLVNSHIMES